MEFSEVFEAEKLIQVLKLLAVKKITEKGAVKVIRVMLDEGGDPLKIVRRLDLMVMDLSEVERLCDEVIEENSQAVSDYISGRKEALNYLVGQVMKKSRGKADPGETNRILIRKLKEREKDSS
jgi:aspartyl-tRNA(Asn)/glutamyl-tRNA(Gln) amidotransferase subunit B